MRKFIVITPVKDSLETTRETISSINASGDDIEYFIFNDFSSEETKKFLDEHQASMGYTLINLEDHVDTPSPNYKTVLQMAQQMAIRENAHLVIIESDVLVRPDTISGLSRLSEKLDNPGLIGSVTTDLNGKINFPYLHVREEDPGVGVTDKSLSFCCTLLTNEFLGSFDFSELNAEKDWYDVFISKQSKRMGFNNYLVKELPVVHKPHSSRPWKMEKYRNPIKYYFKKFFLKRDRI